MVTVDAQTLEQVWSLKPGDRSYLTIDNTQRGVAYNPASGHVLVANRAGSLSVNILDSATGQDVGTLDMTGISGGTFALNLVNVAADGAIYAGNLTIDSMGTAGPYKLYKWANESAVPQLVYSGDPSSADTTASNRRFGDTLEVRGSGTDTQVLLASRSGTVAAVLTTKDGSTFEATKLNVTGISGGDIGLGLGFGEGYTFWGTSNGKNLKKISVNPQTGETTVLNDYDGTVVPLQVSSIAVDPANNLLAGLYYSGTEVDKYMLYDISGTPTLLDSEYTAMGELADNVNGNATGALDFGEGYLFALDSNNGLSAFRVVPIPEPGTLALMGLGSALMGISWLRRKA